MMRRTDRPSADRPGRIDTRHSLVDNWELLRTQRMKRLGAFLQAQRERFGETLEAVAAAARRAGETTSRPTIGRLEKMRDLMPGEEPSTNPSFMDVLFLAYYYGVSLADLERFLLGDNLALMPSDEARLRQLATLWQRLSDAGREDVEGFAAYLVSKEEMIPLTREAIAALGTPAIDYNDDSDQLRPAEPASRTRA